MAEASQGNQPLVFDDDSLDGLLYGGELTAPTPADVFLPMKEQMAGVRRAIRVGDKVGLLAALSAISEGRMALYRPVCDEIIEITKELVPIDPRPILPHELVSLTPLLERIWEMRRGSKDTAGPVAIGDRLYRCYEHQGRFADARRVLRKLIYYASEKENRGLEATYINNLAFEFLLEERWRDAMPLFKKAERLFFEAGDNFNSSNSRANYLTCIFALRPPSELGEYETHLKDLSIELTKDNNWRARKPFVLLSRLCESRGDIAGAIGYMQQAVFASEGKNLEWTQVDKDRLANLEART